MSCRPGGHDERDGNGRGGGAHVTLNESKVSTISFRLDLPLLLSIVGAYQREDLGVGIEGGRKLLLRIYSQLYALRVSLLEGMSMEDALSKHETASGEIESLMNSAEETAKRDLNWESYELARGALRLHPQDGTSRARRSENIDHRAVLTLEGQISVLQYHVYGGGLFNVYNRQPIAAYGNNFVFVNTRGEVKKVTIRPSQWGVPIEAVPQDANTFLRNEPPNPDDTFAFVSTSKTHTVLVTAIKGENSEKSEKPRTAGHLYASGFYSALSQRGALGNVSIRAVATGTGYFLALTNEGVLYFLGRMDGTPEESRQFVTPRMVGEGSWLTMAAGASHAILVDTHGMLASFGSNSHGQMGVPKDPTQSFYDYDDLQGIITSMPTWDGNIKHARCASAAAGERHSLLLLRDGTVYSFGDNRQCQLGIGRTTSIPYTDMPVRADTMSNTIIVAISASENVTMLLAADGNVYYFGGISVGETEHVKCRPQLLEIREPNLENKASRISASGFGYIVALRDGSVRLGMWSPLVGSAGFTHKHVATEGRPSDATVLSHGTR